MKFGIPVAMKILSTYHSIHDITTGTIIIVLGFILQWHECCVYVVPNHIGAVIMYAPLSVFFNPACY